ncbi:MAG: DUF4179 domain-containing protein [Bacillota bacterium]|nr:DUF4179 domain-containing protein [Bacillota bacterium]
MDEKTNVNEDLELDNFMNSLNKSEIPVPEELADKITKRIDTLKPAKRSLGRKVLAVCAIFCFLFAGAVKISPDFAAYASNVPGLENAVEWLRGDTGIKNAQEHGYSAMAPIIIEEKGICT